MELSLQIDVCDRVTDAFKRVISFISGRRAKAKRQQKAKQELEAQKANPTNGPPSLRVEANEIVNTKERLQ